MRKASLIPSKSKKVLAKKESFSSSKTSSKRASTLSKKRQKKFVKEYEDMANILRRDVITMTTQAGSGHPTSCLSMAEIMATLFFGTMKFDIHDSGNNNNDECILSKGHAAPILYAVHFRAGSTHVPLETLRTYGSPYEGHPMPSTFPWAKVATGSLGQGLSVGIGMALANRMHKRAARVYVLCGDGELAEGSIYEALAAAAHYKLDNLCLIVDINRLGQSEPTMLQHNINAYKKRCEAFGCHAISTDGHDCEALSNAYDEAKATKGKPTVILAKTFKGKGVSFAENKEGWHGKPFNLEQAARALREIPNPEIPQLRIATPAKNQKQSDSQITKKALRIPLPFGKEENISTRKAYGLALATLANHNGDIVALDAETKNSTYAEILEKKYPERFIQTYIAEQNLVGMSLGMSTKGIKAYASTFAAFFTRAHDQLRMAGLSAASFTCVGSHAGVSIGEDGPSQMALEDIAMFRSIFNSIVVYPSDAIATMRLLEKLHNEKGIRYMRTTRSATPNLYTASDKFPLGGIKVLKQSLKDKAVLVGAGITLHACLEAYYILKKKGISVAVVDCYSIKPFLATKRLLSLCRNKNTRIIVAEDHYSEGGIAEMLAQKTSGKATVISLAVQKMPSSGPAEKLLAAQGIDTRGIVQAVMKNIQ